MIQFISKLLGLKPNALEDLSDAISEGFERSEVEMPKQDYATLPKTYDEWKERIPVMLKTPEGAVKMYFDGVFAYMDPQTREEGQKMLRYILREDEGWDKKSTTQTFVSRMINPEDHYIFKSFAKGTSSENGYQMDMNSYQLDFVSKKEESDYTNVMVKSSGSDTNKGAWVKQFPDGNWHVVNNANLFGNVRKPAGAVDDFDPNFE